MDEQTKAAIQQANNISKPVTKTTKVKENISKEQIKVATTEPKDQLSKYPFNVKLGKNKEVNFKPWTGKTKKKFKKLFNFLTQEDDVPYKEIIQILIYDNISDSEIFIDTHEQQYLLSLMRKESLRNSFEFEGNCKHCHEPQTIKSTMTESILYKESNFPFKYSDELTFVDIPNRTLSESIFENIQNANDYDGLTVMTDVEMVLHFKYKNEKTPLEILDILDDTNLKELTNIQEALDTCSSKMELGVTKVCVECGKESKFVTDEIPDLFESLSS